MPGLKPGHEEVTEVLLVAVLDPDAGDVACRHPSQCVNFYEQNVEPCCELYREGRMQFDSPGHQCCADSILLSEQSRVLNEVRILQGAASWDE